MSIVAATAAPPVKPALALLAVCLLPSLLLLAGVDFGLAASDQAEADGRGHVVHALLEWTAVVLAAVIALFAYINSRVAEAPVLHVMGLALGASGALDAFHALTALDLVHGGAVEPARFGPFTWMVSRAFSAVILLGGALLVVSRGTRRLRFGRLTVAVVGAVLASTLGVVAAPGLPEAMITASVVARPLDVGPLVLFAVGAVTVFPRLHREAPSAFTAALWVGSIPQVATQLHMAFGSTQLFDHHFMVGHALKVVAYAVPLGGLLLSHHQTVRGMAAARAALEARTGELERAHGELEAFAYSVAHDLRQPLRALEGHGHALVDDHPDLPDDARQLVDRIRANALRMSALLDALLDATRVTGHRLRASDIDLSEVARTAARELQAADAARTVEVRVQDGLRVHGDPDLIGQLVRVLLSNAWKATLAAERPCIEVGAADGAECAIFVRDNGVGFDMAHAGKLFRPFETLHAPGQFGGVGAGLAAARRVVQRHGGRIWGEAAPKSGATFFFVLGGQVA